MGRQYAKRTAVSVGRSREEIQRLLTDWGCKQIAWADDYGEGRTMLRFVWEHNTGSFLARFVLKLPSEEELRRAAQDNRNGAFSERKFEEGEKVPLPPKISILPSLTER